LNITGVTPLRGVVLHDDKSPDGIDAAANDVPEVVQQKVGSPSQALTAQSTPSINADAGINSGLNYSDVYQGPEELFEGIIAAVLPCPFLAHGQ